MSPRKEFYKPINQTLNKLDTMQKEIEEITDNDLAELWPLIGGTPHLFEYGKDELKTLLSTGDCTDCTLTIDYYTMAAIVDFLRSKGFPSPLQ